MSHFQLFAVTGNPVLHSKSPGMFNTAFQESNIHACYTRLAADTAKEAIKTFRSLGMKGMNVTAPFKEEIMPFLDEIDFGAQFIGGVNTIVNKNGKLKGYNTDWIGVQIPILKTLIPKDKWSTTRFDNKKCIIIGASGAGKAAAFAMKDKGAIITIINRTIDKAEQVALKLDCEFAGFEQLSILIPQADIIIIALSQNINPIDPSWLSPKQVIFDANYKDSKIIAMAKDKGCTIIDASDWLLYQGMKAYEYFIGEVSIDNAMMTGLSTYNLQTRCNKIALIGFMGSGKTTVGKKLAKKLNIPFVDTDDLIVEREGKSIPEIFELHGEAYFRKCEREVLQTVINAPGKQIISCGGGLAINDENRALLKQYCLVLWLYATPESTIKRINLETRPLLNVEDPLEKAKSLMKQRKQYYAQASDVIINTEKFDAETISDKIIDEITRII
jgi:shikimate dehydrogenase